jgi:hypothetical protein
MVCRISECSHHGKEDLGFHTCKVQAFAGTSQHSPKPDAKVCSRCVSQAYCATSSQFSTRRIPIEPKSDDNVTQAGRTAGGRLGGRLFGGSSSKSGQVRQHRPGIHIYQFLYMSALYKVAGAWFGHQSVQMTPQSSCLGICSDPSIRVSAAGVCNRGLSSVPAGSRERCMPDCPLDKSRRSIRLRHIPPQSYVCWVNRLTRQDFALALRSKGPPVLDNEKERARCHISCPCAVDESVYELASSSEEQEEGGIKYRFCLYTRKKH